MDRGEDRAALDALMPSVFDELKGIAAAYLAREHHARTLQATALVNGSVPAIGQNTTERPGRIGDSSSR